MTDWMQLILAFAQTDGMVPDVTDLEKTVILGGFAAAVAGIAVFLARDIIFRKKSSYDSEDLGSKKDRTYEKYHSDWGDDYEEMGRRNQDVGFDRDDAPDCYEILGLEKDATQEEIKARFRELAKKTHPDRTGEDSEGMAELNRAYETLSDERSKKRYDSMMGL
ncbi:MAG: J domain-containing protein [Nitrosopumilus sp. H13]|nr:MAG: J domain-containing protein [Nitrosopumilus sp. H13]